MTAAESRTQLRAAVFTRNVHGLLRLLEGDGWPSDALQLIGDGLIDALRSGVGEAADSARRCVAELRARGWDGDHALAEALEVALGTAPVHRLRPVPVDLEDVATALDGGFSDETEIDLITGDLRFGPDADIDDEDDEQEREWLPIEARGSTDGYRDLQAFIAQLDDDEVADRLSAAIDGRGAFRRFKDTIARWPDLWATWFAFSEERQRGRARDWLADEGLTPVRERKVGSAGQ